MKCAYCGQDAKGTKEHIISCAILDIFPECYATIDNIREKVHLGDPVIKDVCGKCNNEKISYIDSYAKDIISKYFIRNYKKDEVLAFNYDYTLIQKMLLKYAYNDLRSQKADVSFFTKNILNYLMEQDIVGPLRNITILAGLAVNTSPIPDFWFGNNKIRWGKNPVFLSNSIIEHINYDTGQTSIRLDNPRQIFKQESFSYVFRFNSIQFLLIGWNDCISDDDLKENDIVLSCQYPYTILNNQCQHTISRCTSESTYHHEMLIDVTWGQGILDDISWMRGTYSDKNQQYLKEVDARWKKEEENLAQRFPRKT